MKPAPAHELSIPTPPGVSDADLKEAIRRRAREIYERSGQLAGRDEQNWKQAEADVLRGYGAQSTRKAMIVILIDGVQFTGEYVVSASDGYKPGEWYAGAPVPVRFEGEKMFLRRRNGQELETIIVKK